MKNDANLERDSILCATSFVFASTDPNRFDKLAGCFADMGFTTPCATLWAYSAATAAFKCAGVCITEDDTQQTVLNGPAPACENEACLSCSNVWQGDFDALAGRTTYNSGITERIARPCDRFTRIVHDPCPGNITRGVVATESPTMTPGDGSGASILAVSFVGMMVTTIAAAVLVVL
jgi:hypothetical protein